MIYVSYYGNSSAISKEDCYKFSISCGNGGYNFKKCGVFVPSWSIVSGFKNGDISWNEYCDKFLSNLKGEKVEIVVDWLSKCDKDVILFCYERDNKRCHRSLVCEFLNKNGVKCKEF